MIIKIMEVLQLKLIDCSKKKKKCTNFYSRGGISAKL